MFFIDTLMCLCHHHALFFMRAMTDGGSIDHLATNNYQDMKAQFFFIMELLSHDFFSKKVVTTWG